MTNQTASTADHLIDIPVIAGPVTPLELLFQETGRDRDGRGDGSSYADAARALMLVSASHYGGLVAMPKLGMPALKAAGSYVTPWFDRLCDAGAIPRHMADEMRAVRRLFGPAGILLNLSTSFGCTAAVMQTAGNEGVLIRSLDWTIGDGMGARMIVHRASGPAGDFWNISYPGFIGVLSAVAPWRFAATINQAPIPGTTGRMVDFIPEKDRTLRSRNIPAPLLLREVMETAPDFDAALAILRDRPLAEPIIFTLAGADGRHAIIERTRDQAMVHRDMAGTANHWQNGTWKGHARIHGTDRNDSANRACALSAHARNHPDSAISAWLKAPVLNHHTRQAMALDAREDAETPVRVVAFDELGKGAQRALHIVTREAHVARDGTARHMVFRPR